MKKLIFLLLASLLIQLLHAQPDERHVQELMFKAETYYRLDSFQKALDGDAKNPGFLSIIQLYPTSNSANLAHYYAGTCYLRLNNYKKAIAHLLLFRSSDPKLSSTAYKLIADAYADNNDPENAYTYYEKAANAYYLKMSGVSKYDSVYALTLHQNIVQCAEILLKDPIAAAGWYQLISGRFRLTGEGQKAKKKLESFPVITGAERIRKYLPFIKGKRVGIFANQTSMIGNKHLVDTLSKLGIDIKVIFGPEHGFRGTADAGEKIDNTIDAKTGIPVVSLYGTKRKATAADMKDVDVLIFDIQDVGVRFYTFISSLEEFIETALEFNKPLIILDRPNPNGHYVDGPVLDMKYKSFVGMQPVPVVYGMTVAEYAEMILNEPKIGAFKNYQKYMHKDSMPVVSITDPTKVLYYVINNGFYSYEFEYQDIRLDQFGIIAIRCINYDHKSKYVLPIKPSPNLPNIQSIYLYPSTCLFEGTALSEGRGTNKPFQVFGHPALPKTLFSFTPNPNEGAKSSKHYGKVCYGWDLSGTPEDVLKKVDNRIQLKWLIEAYKLFPQKDSFFLLPKSGNMEQSFFVKLSGNNELWQQIKAGKSEEEIRKSWEPKLNEFKKIRKKYLLYEDFE
jgi:uncharacterized protein YbbC (DUF1343 family)